MNVLAPVAPQMIPGRAIDIAGEGPTQGMARVDRSDPVFFDHPLDHLPGMLVLAAGLELADHGCLLDCPDVNLRLTFTKFCELDDPVQVTATRQTDGTSSLEFIQSGHDVANGRLTQSDWRPLAEYVAMPAMRSGPISAGLVHRADRRNIAIGPLAIEDGRVWTRIRKQAAINGLPPRASAVATILEATRQFTTAILHRWGGHPFGIKMIFVGLTAQLPTTVSPARVTQALSWRVTAAAETNKVRIDLHETTSPAAKIGSVIIAARCVNEDEYARLRAS